MAAGKATGWIVMILVIAALTAAVLAATGVIPVAGQKQTAGGQSPDSKAERPPIAVTVGEVKTRQIQRTVDAVGSFQGFEEVTIAPEVSGRVVKLYHDRQDRVRPGDLLLEIDPKDYQLAVEEARRGLASELAKIKLTSIPPENLDVRQFLESLPNYRKSLNVEANAMSKRERAAGLFRSRTLTKEEYDQAATDYEVAKALREQAELEALSTLATARLKDALLKTSEDRLADTQIKVPEAKQIGSEVVGDIDYVIATRNISEGEMATPGMPGGVFHLVIDGVLKLRASIPERFVADVRIDQPVEIRVEAYEKEKKVFQGRVLRISPTVERLSRTFEIEVLVPNKERLLKPGGFAKLAVLTQIDPQAMTVPLESVVSFAGVNKVFVVRDGAASMVEVSPGVEGQGWIEVTPKKAGELAPGMQVVTTGHAQMADGSKVRVREKE